MAERFAGPNGVLLRLDLLPERSRSRDIRTLSCIVGEDEVCYIFAQSQDGRRGYKGPIGSKQEKVLK